MYNRHDHIDVPHDGEEMSLDAFEQLVQQTSECRYEYVAGRAYAMAGGTATHNRLTFAMARLIDEHFRSGPCRVFLADMYVALADDHRVLPDVVVTCDVADYRNNATLIRSPHLIVEVLSPATERIDRLEKFEAYKALSSVKEYVLVSQKQQLVEVYRRIDGWLPHMYRPGEIIELMSLDITVSVDELYAGL